MHVTKTYRGVKVQLHPLTLALYVGEQLYEPVALSFGKSLAIHCIGGWVGPSSGLVALKRKSLASPGWGQEQLVFVLMVNDLQISQRLCKVVKVSCTSVNFWTCASNFSIPEGQPRETKNWYNNISPTVSSKAWSANTRHPHNANIRFNVRLPSSKSCWRCFRFGRVYSHTHVIKNCKILYFGRWQT